MFPIRTILHPTDFSPGSDVAYELACSLAKERGARLIVLHVYPPPRTHGEVVARRSPDSYEEALWDVIRKYEAPPGVTVGHRLEEGDTVEDILTAAQECGADLIVMGTHGRTGLRRVLMGSVAENVVRRAPCAVLTVRDHGPVGGVPPEQTAVTANA